jgi:hypothetical protein
MKADDAKRLKDLERENARLKWIVADQALDIDMLKELNRGNNFFAVLSFRVGRAAREITVGTISHMLPGIRRIGAADVDRPGFEWTLQKTFRSGPSRRGIAADDRHH